MIKSCARFERRKKWKGKESGKREKERERERERGVHSAVYPEDDGIRKKFQILEDPFRRS